MLVPLTLLFAIHFFWIGSAENSGISRLEIKETEEHRCFQMILRELVERIPDLVKQKYSNILFDFLRKGSSGDLPHHWCVSVALNEATRANFACENKVNEKSALERATNARLKTINGVHYDGDVQLEFYEREKEVQNDLIPRYEITVRSLYVADYRPSVSGALILNFVKKLADCSTQAIATLDDCSNLKTLAFITTGKSYYEHLGFHYLHIDGTKMAEERRKFQDTQINAILFQNCVSQRLHERLQVRSQSFLFDGALKGAILGALKAEIGSESRQLEEFWKIFRNVMKRVDFYALQAEHGFEEDLQRYAKTYFFTRFFRECLQKQIIKDHRLLGFGFSLLDRMIYP